jgi:PAS domain S-box-containing protein
MPQPFQLRDRDCLAGAGETAALMRDMDWESTALGPVSSWPQSLQTAVGICVASRFPIVIYWGAEHITLYNDAYARILARKHPWALGRPAREVWAEVWDVLRPMLDGVLSTGSATWSDDLLLVLHRNGYPEECYFSFSFSPLRVEDCRVGGVFTAVTETTAKVRSAYATQEALLREYGLRESILDSMTDSFFAIGPDWRFTYLNRRAAEQMKALGKDPRSLIGKVLWEEFAEVPNKVALHQVMTQRLPATDELYYAPLGEWVENHMYPSDDGGIVTFQRYITARKRAEMALRRSQSYLAEGQRLTHTGSWGWKIMTGEVYWSEEQSRIFGFDPAGPPPALQDAMQLIHPEDRDFVREALVSAVRELRDHEWRCRAVTRDGSIKHLLTTAHPVFEDGVLVEYVGTTMDITERVRSEDALRQAQEALSHATRVITMGEVLASVAHELNQPLAAIVAYGAAGVRWLARNGPDIEEARAAFQRIVRDGERAGDSLRRVRELVAPRDRARIPVRIAELIDGVTGMLGEEARTRGVCIRTEHGGDLPLVEAAAVELQQVLLNLALNGIEAMSTAQGRPRILKIAARRHGEGGVVVAVSDSGCGFAPDQAERIFAPFFSTKPGGLGMGLAISRSIIEAHEGALWAALNGDHGATFQFTLPVGAGPAPGAAGRCAGRART